MAEEKRKVALITGITGQDGSYLAEFLLEKGYTVSDRCGRPCCCYQINIADEFVTTTAF
jgi:GDPmannose 4,6-dehydratase